MPDRRNYHAALASKGLEASVTEEQARAMCSSQGRHSVFIVDARHGKLTVAEDGTQRITLVIDQAELVSEEHTARVRAFMRALYLARPEQYGQEPFEGGDDEPKVGDAAADLDALVERDETGEPVGIWDGSAPDGNVAPLFKS